MLFQGVMTAWMSFVSAGVTNGMSVSGLFAGARHGIRKSSPGDNPVVETD